MDTNLASCFKLQILETISDKDFNYTPIKLNLTGKEQIYYYKIIEVNYNYILQSVDNLTNNIKKYMPVTDTWDGYVLIENKYIINSFISDELEKIPFNSKKEVMNYLTYLQNYWENTAEKRFEF